MNVVSSHVKDQNIKTILDLGCGTGRFTEALAVRFDADVVGVDPSQKMLEQARSKQRDHKHQHDRRIRYETGRGESIPLPDNSVDLIFMSMIFHHFDNPALAAKECRRVLRGENDYRDGGDEREGGTAFLRAGTRERIPSYPYVDFFPASRAILEEVLSTNMFMREVFETAGFQMITLDLVTQEIAPNYAAYAEKLAAGADSVLAKLSRRDFDAGMTALRAHAVHSDGEAVFEPIDVFVFR